MASNLRFTLEYDGTRYRGWQEQRNTDRTVAGVLKRALAEAGFEGGELGAAGRTDAGVHALAQVAHLRTPREVDPGRLVPAVNALLPHDVCLLRAERAPARFHARHDAVERSYLYQVSRRRSAFAKRFVWWVRDRLDAGAMAECAARTLGRHDFVRLCERPGEQPSTLVVVERAEVAEEGDLIVVRLAASHFLWRMVRRIVGVLVEAGAGRLPPETMAGILDVGRPLREGIAPAAWTAPPSGLFLEKVRYPGDPPLGPLRAAVPLPGSGPGRASGAHARE